MLQDEERGVGRRKQLRVYAQFSVLDSCCARARGPGVPVRRPARLGAGEAATGSPARGYGERTAGWECAQGHSPPTAGSTSGSSKYPTRCICRVEIKRSAASCPTLPRATSATSSVAPLNAGAAPAPAALNGISHANFPAPPPSLFSSFAVPARTRLRVPRALHTGTGCAEGAEGKCLTAEVRACGGLHNTLIERRLMCPAAVCALVCARKTAKSSRSRTLRMQRNR